MDAGRRGRRSIIRGGHVMSMDPDVGDFVVGPNLRASGAAVIDARGRIVMPGFVDTHHHQFETAPCAASSPAACSSTTANRMERSITSSSILGGFAPVYRPWDVYINELFGERPASTVEAGGYPSA
jgi:hypothetical protein